MSFSKTTAMDYYSVFLIGACVVVSTTGHIRDHTGKRFIAAFFRNLDLNEFDAYILITPTTEVNTTANILVEHQSLLYHFSFTLTSRHVEQLNLRNLYKKGSSNKYPNIQNPVYELNASNPVTVTALVKGPNSISSYLVYPVEVAGREFRMVPYCNTQTNGLCVCSLVTLHENTTINLQNNYNGNISIFTQNHPVGENTIDSLSLPNHNRSFVANYTSSYIALESFDDFSGLLLQTTSPVVVFCGGARKGATTSMEQILPVTQYGRDFYSFPVDRKDMQSSKLRFVSHYNSTTVSINNAGSWLLDAGKFKDEPIQDSNTYSITSNNPIGLFQIFSGNNSSKSERDNKEGMVIVPSNEQYIQSVLVPRLQIPKDSLGSFMHIGFVSQVKFTYQTYKGFTDRITIVKDVIMESDNDGKVLKLSMTRCKTDEGSNNISAYIYRTTKGDVSFSIAGLKLISERTDKSRVEENPSVPLPPGSTTTTIIDDIITSDTIENSAPQHTTCLPCQPQSDTTTGNTAATTAAFKTTSFRTETEEQLQEKIKEIKKALTINKNELSSYRRKKTSADDNRSSAKGIGVLGACVICAVVSFIIILDFKTLVHQGSILWKRSVGSCTRSLSANASKKSKTINDF